MSRRVPNENVILSYMHCGLCLSEIQQGATDSDNPPSPAEYQQLEVGWTKIGLQVWCKRHNVNVVHIDFEGHRHPANTTRKRIPNEEKP
jgi:hypothetical protein